MAFPKNRCTAKKTSKCGVTYIRHGEGAMRATMWPLGDIWCIRIQRDDALGGKFRYEEYRSRKAAMYAIGEWLDPEHNGKHILDNDSQNLRTMNLDLIDIQSRKFEELCEDEEPILDH